MNVLVTGASGFLGYHLSRYLEVEHSVCACWHTHAVSFDSAQSLHLDFEDADATRELMLAVQPTHIVHAGAMALANKCEEDHTAAWRTNVQGTRNILDAAQVLSQQPHILYISTDLVFDGTKSYYTETDAAHPLMVYGRTKLQGEQECATYSGPCTILRSALIYGPLDAEHPSFLDWMVQGIRAGDGTLFADEYRSPVFVRDLCDAILACCEKRATGLFHTAGPERLSRYDFGLLLANAIGEPRDKVRSGLSSQVQLKAPRPADVSLDIRKARSELGYSPLSPREALQEIFAQRV